MKVNKRFLYQMRILRHTSCFFRGGIDIEADIHGHFEKDHAQPRFFDKNFLTKK